MSTECQAKQVSDQMRCERCDLLWDCNDPDVPQCKTGKEIFAANKITLHEINMGNRLPFGDAKNFIDTSVIMQPILNLEIGGFIYRFSVADVNPAAYEWFFHTVQRQMLEIHQRAETSTKLKMQNQFKDLMGINHA